MPVCQYFLRGHCRYGNKCWNDHPRGNGSAQRSLAFGDNPHTYGGSSGNQFKWVNPQNSAAARADGPVSAHELAENFPNEVGTWLKSNMWPFSCVALERYSPCLPEFEDVSPEELRLEAYLAQKSNAFPSYVEKVRVMLEGWNARKQQLIRMTPNMKAKLVQFIETARNALKSESSASSVFGGSGSVASGSSGGLFNSTPSNDLFGTSVGEAKSSFGGASSFGGSSTFGGSSSFGGSSLFGGTSPLGNAAFGGNIPFGKAPGTTSVFGGVAPETGGAVGPFGKPLNSGAQSSTGFGASGSGTFGSGASGIFGILAGAASTPSSIGSAFGGSTTQQPLPFGGGAFGSSLPPQSFGTPSPANLGTSPSGFGSRTLFAAGQGPLVQLSSGKPGLFGASQQESQPQPTKSQAEPFITLGQTSRLYTPLGELMPEELYQFQASSFTLGKIPLRPPPQELINL